MYYTDIHTDYISTIHDPSITLTLKHVALLFLPLADATGCVIITEVNGRGVDAKNALNPTLCVDGLERHAETTEVAPLHTQAALALQ